MSQGKKALYQHVFVRKKRNKSGVISIQVISKSKGKYKVLTTIGSSIDPTIVEKYYKEGQEYIKKYQRLQELDFADYPSLYHEVISSIMSHELIGIELVLGKIFDEIGFNKIKNKLFRDLSIYRLIYPKSKLKTTEYLYRYEGKSYSEDEIYRYMDKLHNSQKEIVQRISYEHTKKILPEGISVVFYDVTTIYFEIDTEDEIRKTGFSKEGKHQHPQIVLGLLVSKAGYPLAYEIYEGNKFEGHTMLPILESFKAKYNIENLKIVADSGLLSNDNINELQIKNYEFIIGARIKNENKLINEKIKELSLTNGESKIVQKSNLKLIVSYSEARAKKDQHNREKGLKRLEKLIQAGKLSKSSINNKGYNKFLVLDGEISINLDQNKIQQDLQWDGLKGYLTNSKLCKEDIIENYKHLWQIEKAFRIAKTDLKIRPIFHYKRRRIEAHICLSFVAYKIYKEMERQLKAKNSTPSPEKVVEIIQSIYQTKFKTPNQTIIKHLLILTDEQRMVKELFNF